MTRELYTGTDPAQWPLAEWYDGIECDQPGCRGPYGAVSFSAIHTAAELVDRIRVHMAECEPYRAARAAAHRDATLAGLAATTRRGGRPTALTPEQLRLIARARAQRPPVPISDLARALGASRSTVDRAVRRLSRGA